MLSQFSIFLFVDFSDAPGRNSCFAPEALWVCVAVAAPPVTPDVLLPDVNNATGSRDENINFPQHSLHHGQD